MHAKKDLWRQLNSFSWMFHWVCWKNNTLFRSLVFTGCMILSWVCHCSPPIVSDCQALKGRNDCLKVTWVVFRVLSCYKFDIFTSPAASVAPPELPLTAGVMVVWLSTWPQQPGPATAPPRLRQLLIWQLLGLWWCPRSERQRLSYGAAFPLHQGLQEALACWALVVGLKLGWYGH